MYFIYLTLRVFPLWALPFAYILTELGIRMRQKGNNLPFAICALCVFILLTMTVLWVVYSGWTSWPMGLKDIVNSGKHYNVY